MILDEKEINSNWWAKCFIAIMMLLGWLTTSVLIASILYTILPNSDGFILGCLIVLLFLTIGLILSIKIMNDDTGIDIMPGVFSCNFGKGTVQVDRPIKPKE